MRKDRFLLTALVCLLPVFANAQSLALVDFTPAETYTPRADISFTVVEPDHRFLPDGYKPQDSGFEIHGMIEAALSRTLDGIVEYRWNEGGNPTLNIAGVPAGVKMRRSTLLFGVNYEL